MDGSSLLRFSSSASIDVLLSLLAFVGICAGHAAVLVFCLNWTYSHPLPRGFLRLLRRLDELVIFAGPPTLGLACWYDLFVIDDRPWGWRIFLFGYVGLCGIVGLLVMPVITVGRMLRRRPAVLIDNHSQVFDVATELGYKPVGRGKHQRLARLPFNQVFQVDFSERTLRLPRLPAAWDGLTILHLSDLHLNGVPDRVFYQRVMDRCRDWGECDLLAVTGDFVDTPLHHRWLMPVLGRLRWKERAFAVLGNHDAHFDADIVRRRLRRLGFDVVGNGWRQIEVRGESMLVIGHEGPWFLPAPDLGACPQGPFRLCLSHTPDNVYWGQRQGIDLMLAGHTHGGQIRFPIIGSVLVPSRYGRRFDCGVFHVPPTVLHVSRGLAGQHPLRYYCRPEVTRIVLRAKETSS